MKSREQRAAYMREWRRANPGKNGAACAKWQSANKDKVRAYYTSEKENARKSKWRKENRALMSAAVRRCRKAKPELYRPMSAKFTAKRRATKLHATPLWADMELIGLVYAEAAHRGLHVDHIVPLISKKVCGLHVHNNLQLLSQTENARKGNRFDHEATL